MQLIYSIYGLIRYIVLAYEPDAKDEFDVLDSIIGYGK